MRATMSDGSVVSGPPAMIKRAIDFYSSWALEQAAWVTELRQTGVKAAHPDDGWVDRIHNKIHLCYPQFNDGLEIGDQLALGTHRGWRIVRVTGFSENWIAQGIDPDADRWYIHFA